MKTAVLVYNNNTISTRSETFIVLSVIAWTYVLHCYYRSISIEPVYLDDTGNAQIVDGKEKLWELSHCIKHQQCPLNDGEVRNLRYIIAIRNEVEHRSCEDINQDVQAKLQATALNFIKFCDSKFGSQYNFSEDLAFTIQLTALQLSSTNALKNEATVSKAVSVVNKLFEGNLSAADYNDQSYAYRVYVIPKVTNNPKKADQAVAFASVGSELEMAIKNIERPKHLATQAIEILKTRGFPTLTSHGFTQAWKQNDLKNTGKGFAIKLGIQWFWYDEGLDKIAEMLAQQV